jgi:uncharacterized protein
MLRPATRFLTLLVVLATLLWTTIAQAAFEPPPLRGHVVDLANMLAPREVQRLNAKLDAARRQSGFAVVVLTVPSLDGEPIADVAYNAFNTWKIGSKEGDDGVLLVIAPNDRQTQIETGKGVGGALTDLESHHINRDVIWPRLRAGQNYEAIDRGTDAILKALVEDTPGGISAEGRGPAPGADGELPPPDPLKTAIMGLGLLLVIILAIVSPTFRHILFFMLLFGRRGGGGGGGFGGGGGYGGGGGSSGGGGAGGNY